MGEAETTFGALFVFNLLVPHPAAAAQYLHGVIRIRARQFNRTHSGGDSKPVKCPLLIVHSDATPDSTVEVASKGERTNRALSNQQWAHRKVQNLTHSRPLHLQRDLKLPHEMPLLLGPTEAPSEDARAHILPALLKGERFDVQDGHQPFRDHAAR